MQIFYGITQRIVWLVTFICMRIFYKFSVTGKKNLKDISTPLLVISNHKSYWDSMILGTLFPFFSNKYLPLGFMAGDKFFLNPFYNFFLTTTGVCHANKGKGLDTSLKDFRSILLNKGVVIIFPYGKMVSDDNARPVPGRGASTLVQEFNNLTILPIFLQTVGKIKFSAFLFGKKKMSVIVGNPYKITDARNKNIDEISAILVNSFHILNKK
ncbi:hypothetical protein A3A05_02265 [Candidatus Nomurabacteria bacterium RIFCSPLOWO2_01_FULL_41_12]|uniref:Phospholipid/glycerol acyltransferase domain-containing protein n=1 Tax=Candidatus Nomurabacteria bacterium RIFCSPLOWO2_01_FULL_41_12 TaxID=1801774 RepID=A0A1F6WUI3_9BACT|nr:MAG: hypothetical protein A2732_02185 [Candidatus Nomurabacteria bacterium RIFCSPHIGHO2_01_FULL_40_10]OGI85537.1 MAG: hypothetical protein A3A05_02265 [Candidatus Nomurabacteria bacterium RIFCSPLOWO2_01_FULL_41_12]